MNILFISAIFFMLLFDKLNIFLYILISSVLHEFGHISASLVCGVKPRVKASIFGLKLKSDNIYNSKKIIILLAGPFVNFLLVIICNIILNYNFSLKVYIFLSVNLIIMLFNLLPINFLDGGQVLNFINDNFYLQKTMDILSILIIIIIIFIFSSNVYYSISALSIFLLYYILNTSTDI